MAMAMAILSSSSVLLPARPPASFASSFKGLPLHLLSRTPYPPLVFPSRPLPLPLVAHQGYKLKSHKASAKRFRVTGSGKIVCRRAGKQHLLAKKNTKRRNRLSKMALVNKCDYENITHALPYLKVSKR